MVLVVIVHHMQITWKSVLDFQLSSSSFYRLFLLLLLCVPKILFIVHWVALTTNNNLLHVQCTEIVRIRTRDNNEFVNSVSEIPVSMRVHHLNASKSNKNWKILIERECERKRNEFEIIQYAQWYPFLKRIIVASLSRIDDNLVIYVFEMHARTHARTNDETFHLYRFMLTLLFFLHSIAVECRWFLPIDCYKYFR